MLVRGGWSTPRASSFAPGKETRYPLSRRLGGPQGLSGQLRKTSSPPQFDARTIQPVASHYTECAIPTHVCERYRLECRPKRRCLSLLYTPVICWYVCVTSNNNDCYITTESCTWYTGILQWQQFYSVCHCTAHSQSAQFSWYYLANGCKFPLGKCELWVTNCLFRSDVRKIVFDLVLPTLWIYILFLLPQKMLISFGVFGRT